MVDIDTAGRLGLIARENELHEVYDLRIIVYMHTPFFFFYILRVGIVCESCTRGIGRYLSVLILRQR